jgi:hypothetical protein
VKALRTCAVAVVAATMLWGAATTLGGVPAARAQLPPGWTPGTFYNNVSNSPFANPANSPMPNRRPTDPPATNTSSSQSTLSGWTIDGFRAQPPSPLQVSVDGQYCTDSSGGSIWVAAGAPTDQLTCPSADPASQ